MRQWVAERLEGVALDVPDGVPDLWLQRVEALLAPLDAKPAPQGRRGLAQALLRFVLQDAHPAVLDEVAGNASLAGQLQLTGYFHDRSDDPPDVYEHFDQLPPAVALRWARLLAASVRAIPVHDWFPLPGGATWPGLLLLHSAGCSVGVWSSARPVRHLCAAHLETLLREDGLDADGLLVAAFATPVGPPHETAQHLQMVTGLAGYAQALDRHLDAVRPHLLAEPVAQRLHVLQLLAAAAPASLRRLAPLLCKLATASSRQVRSAAAPLLRPCGDAADAPLAALAAGGKPEQRGHALSLAFQLAAEQGDAAGMERARQAARADKAASVQALAAQWEARQLEAAAAPGHDNPPLPAIDWQSGIPAPVLQQFWQQVHAAVEQSNQRSYAHHAQMAAQGHHFRLQAFPPYTEADQDALQRYLDAASPTPPTRPQDGPRAASCVMPCLTQLAEDGALAPVGALKLLLFFELAVAADGTLQMRAGPVLQHLHRRTGRPTLLELSAMLDACGHSGKALLLDYCLSWSPFAEDWPAADVWPYFAHHADALVDALTDNPGKTHSFDRARLYHAVATLPHLPAALVDTLFGLALGPAKTERLPAQEALRGLAGKEQRIALALAHGKAEVRMLAAQWLGRLRHGPAIADLERALRKEKNDLAKGAMLDALQQLGQAVERYLDRDALAAEAAKSLAKGLPKELDWFPWSTLPAVRWADGRGPVPPDVLRWMLLQAFKQKQPEPNAVLRKYCAMFEARDREAFGQCVLEAWLQEDVLPVAPEEARLRARKSAEELHRWMARHPQYYQDDPQLGMSVEALAAAYLPAALRQPVGSVVGSKGLLAVVAACAGGRAAASAQRFLKDWYGSRAAQGKALIAMLAWIEHPSATQLVLAVGARFRTRSFQEEAARQAEALAERKGWSLAELADRTIPSAGFDEDAVLTLDYGQRVFQARLLPDFRIALFNPEGRKIAALPEPRQDDDADAARQSRKAFGTVRKEIKNIVALQADRLYEALCTQREWSWADWQAYLFAHPVVRHLVQRLIWVQVEEGRAVQAFRPLDDASLSDCADNAVTLPETARVRLAHDSLLGSEAIAAWQQHLLDYEVMPLFQQLGKGHYSLPAALAQADEVADFEGHMLGSFALRGRALKLGYTRSPAEDGGWFYVYEKRFATLGLVASIEFTGNPLPEANRPVALRHLSFASTQAGDRQQHGKMALAKLPAILLSECYHDLRLIAAEGPGFDPDWEKKSGQ